MTTRKPGLPVIPFASREAWEAWLEEHHAISEGAWLKLAKKGSGLETVCLAEAINVALCYGWIDSQAKGFDDHYWLQRFTARRPGSKWSKVNRGKVTDRGRQDETRRPAGGGACQSRRSMGRVVI